MEVQNSADLTGIKKLVFEACQKIQQGEALVQQGNIELENLLGKAAPTKKRKTVANRTVRAPSTFHNNTQSDDQLLKRIHKVVAKDPAISLLALSQKIKVGERRLLRVIGSDKSLEYKNKQISKVEESAEGKAADDLKEKVIELLKNNEWMTKQAVQLKLGCDFYRLEKCLKQLFKEKVIKTVKKTNNPAHKDIAGGSYNREFAYLELV